MCKIFKESKCLKGGKLPFPALKEKNEKPLLPYKMKKVGVIKTTVLLKWENYCTQEVGLLLQFSRKKNPTENLFIKKYKRKSEKV